VWPEHIARSTLLSLCLVNRALYSAAKPWLWSKIEVRLPHNWLALVDAISGAPEDEEAAEGAIVQAIEQVTVNAITSPSAQVRDMPDSQRRIVAEEVRESVIARLSDMPPDGSIPIELLSPPASREPSPRRFNVRAQSPGRWRLMRAITSAVQQAISGSSLGVYGTSISLHTSLPCFTIRYSLVPTPEDPRPGRHIQHLDFNHFRTIGMRRSVEEGVSNRFVTATRVYRILQVCVFLYICTRLLTSIPVRKCRISWHLVQPNTWMVH
jgi:hypothetical protein